MISFDVRYIPDADGDAIEVTIDDAPNATRNIKHNLVKSPWTERFIVANPPCCDLE